MKTQLDSKVRAALEARRGDWPAIAQRAGVSHSWLSQFVRGLIPNPGIETLRAVAAALKAPTKRTVARMKAKQ